jgi:hypothetical protein
MITLTLEKAKEILRKKVAGETLTDSEKALLKDSLALVSKSWANSSIVRGE